MVLFVVTGVKNYGVSHSRMNEGVTNGRSTHMQRHSWLQIHRHISFYFLPDKNTVVKCQTAFEWHPTNFQSPKFPYVRSVRLQATNLGGIPCHRVSEARQPYIRSAWIWYVFACFFCVQFVYKYLLMLGVYVVFAAFS